MRALFAAGGTGGHIYPAIAVAKEVVRRHAGAGVRFVGTSRGLETKLVPQAGFELSLIESAGLMNMGLAARLRGLAVLPKSFLDARRVIRDFRDLRRLKRTDPQGDPARRSDHKRRDAKREQERTDGRRQLLGREGRPQRRVAQETGA